MSKLEDIQNLSRRDFLKLCAGAGGALFIEYLRRNFLEDLHQFGINNSITQWPDEMQKIIQDNSDAISFVYEDPNGYLISILRYGTQEYEGYATPGFFVSRVIYEKERGLNSGWTEFVPTKSAYELMLHKDEIFSHPIHAIYFPH